jgi:hypothetical protein
MEKLKNRKVVLMGAGAVLDFGAPKTEELTNLLIEDAIVGEINKGIFDALKCNKIYRERDINFESIIHFLDSIINYLRSDTKSGFKDIYNAFSDVDKNIMSILRKIDKLDLRDCNDIMFPRLKKYERVVKLLFYNYNYILIPRISNYAINNSTRNNVILKKWYVNQVSSNLFRFYSVNYDRIIPNLLKDIFDGFNYQKKAKYSLRSGLPDVKKILYDVNIPSYYNLHGCIQWGISLFTPFNYWGSYRKDVILPSIHYKSFNNNEP